MILGGLGSRGYVFAPLARERLTARMLGEVWPMDYAWELREIPLVLRLGARCATRTALERASGLTRLITLVLP